METIRNLTDIFRFSKKENKWKKYKDCEIISEFMFARNNFFLIKIKNAYFVCIPCEDGLKAVWNYAEKADNHGYVISQFRNGFLKNSIKQADIDTFLSDPINYKKARH